MNQVNLIGNLGADPESRDVGETSVCNFRMATSETWKDKSGEKQERTDWHKIECWGKLAELCQQYLSKGRKVRVTGSLRYDKVGEGDDAKWYTKIKATEVEFLGGKVESTGEEPSKGGSDVSF